MLPLSIQNRIYSQVNGVYISKLSSAKAWRGPRKYSLAIGFCEICKLKVFEARQVKTIFSFHSDPHSITFSHDPGTLLEGPQAFLVSSWVEIELELHLGPCLVGYINVALSHFYAWFCFYSLCHSWDASKNTPLYWADPPGVLTQNSATEVVSWLTCPRFLA